jgi:hypothetical protein
VNLVSVTVVIVPDQFSWMNELARLPHAGTSGKTSHTKARHPQTNRICERFPRTIQEECYVTPFAGSSTSN